MDLDKDLERTAQQYRDEGYAVTLRPGPELLPEFAAGFSIDLLAERGAEHVLVRVQKNRTEFENDPNVLRQAEIANAQPGWQYDLVVVERDNPVRRFGRKAGEPTVEQIEQMFGEAERMLSLGSPRAAFVLAWSGLEAVMRRAVQQFGLDRDPGTQIPVLIGQLYSTGHVSHQEFRRLEEGRRLRTVLVHGFAPPVIDPETVPALVASARRLLAEAENLQTAAS